MKDIWQLKGENPKQGYLLVILHGRGDSPQGWSSYLDELNIPNLSACLLRAPDEAPGGGYSWYGRGASQLEGIKRSSILIEKKFQEFKERGFAHEKIILFGFSQGCLMTLEFGGRYPQMLAGYIGISGYCYDADALVKDAPEEIKQAHWLMTHGTTDDVLPFKDTQEQVKVLQRGGFNIEFKVYQKAHTWDETLEAPEVKKFILKCMKNPLH